MEFMGGEQPIEFPFGDMRSTGVWVDDDGSVTLTIVFGHATRNGRLVKRDDLSPAK